MSKPTFYTAFANSVSEKDFLPNLSDEALKIADLLQRLAFDDRLYFIKDEIFDLDRLIMNFSKYGEKFDHFYFSGHGKDGCLRLTDNFTAGLLPMANVINASLKNLKLGFFNACETYALAKEVVHKRSQSKTTEKLVLIACKSEISTFIAERFATLFFTQIGQPGTYRDAYDQAKSLVCLMNSKIRFREFSSVDELDAAGDDFDYAYIEVEFKEEQSKPGSRGRRSGKDNKPAEEKKPTSIIGNDTLMADALTANYIKEVVQTMSQAPMEAAKVAALSTALEAAEQVSSGAKMNGRLDEIFKKAADELPGLNSASAFKSLINVEKHKDDPKVKTIVSGENNNAIKDLVDVVNTIKF